MPNATSGFSGNEVVAYVKSWTGNASSDFQTFVEQSLPLAEFRFCKAHDWAFLHKQNLSLTVASGTSEYTLNTAAIGYEMQVTDVKSIFSVANNLYLKKVTLDQIRRMDPNQDDGSSTAKILCWAPSSDNKIVVYPPSFSDTTLKIDGKVQAAALHTLSAYPTIPYHYQDSYMTYVIALALARENDDRAVAMKQEALGLIKADVQADLANLGDSDQPRIKSLAEQSLDGTHAGTDPLNMFLFNE